MSGMGLEGKQRSIRRALRGLMVPTALNIKEASKVTHRSTKELERLVRQRRVVSWLRDGEVRIPLSEIERLTVRPRASMPETTRRR